MDPFASTSSMISTGDPIFDHFGTIFAVFVGIFVLVFLFVLIRILSAAGKGVAQWNRNNASPVETVQAVLVAKRTQVGGGSRDSGASTWYYVTFEMPGQQREEFGVSGRQWGMLVEGDRGSLTRQGTRFKGFDRVPQDR